MFTGTEWSGVVSMFLLVFFLGIPAWLAVRYNNKLADEENISKQAIK